MSNDSKRRLRRDFCELRECLVPEDAIAASSAVCKRLARFPPLQRADTVMAYLAIRNEIDVRGLFDLLPDIRWTLPRVDGRRMAVHFYNPRRLLRHRFGMLEPAPDQPTVTPDEIDVVLVPGVAFDRQGGRLGYGGGYYDRFLPRTRALRIGVSHSACLIDELPCEAHDARMEWVVTPSELFRCARVQPDDAQSVAG